MALRKQSAQLLFSQTQRHFRPTNQVTRRFFCSKPPENSEHREAINNILRFGTGAGLCIGGISSYMNDKGSKEIAENAIIGGGAGFVAAVALIAVCTAPVYTGLTVTAGAGALALYDEYAEQKARSSRPS